MRHENFESQPVPQVIMITEHDAQVPRASGSTNATSAVVQAPVLLELAELVTPGVQALSSVQVPFVMQHAKQELHGEDDPICCGLALPVLRAVYAATRLHWLFG